MEMEEQNKKIRDPQNSSDQNNKDTDALDSHVENEIADHQDDVESGAGGELPDREPESVSDSERGISQNKREIEDVGDEADGGDADSREDSQEGESSNEDDKAPQSRENENSTNISKTVEPEKVEDEEINANKDAEDRQSEHAHEKEKVAPTDSKTEEEVPTTEKEKKSNEAREKEREEESQKEDDEEKQKADEEKVKASVTEDSQFEESHHHDEEHDHDHEDEEESTLDYSHYSKKQLVQVLESLQKDDDFDQINKILKEIKPAYDEIFNSERDEAYEKYLEEGGEKDGFEYKNDELDERFNKAYNTLRHRKNEYFNSLEAQREQNLEKKMEVLEKLRTMVDAEETTASINELKKIQNEWKSIGPVAPQHLKSLWANYNALIDRYYDNRSIYFELKELDRKKNYELKLELCEKAESLAEEENIKEAVKQLNELHEEFKYIGPVPQEEQENVWVRFKAASDQVYSRRKEFYDQLREQLKVNLVAKQALVEKVQSFTEFDTDRISEWNQKTKEILEIQKEWESIGGLPKDRAKKVNKSFWSAFKTFFNHKGNFFKKLEDLRKENLTKKRELLETAESLKDSEDFEATSNQLKELQKQWKEIGPVPEKYKDEVYRNFKEACDHFFNRRRAHMGKVEERYEDNLKKKQDLSAQLEKMVEEDSVDIDRVHEIVDEYQEIGYVPRNAIKSIQKRFVKAVSDAVDIVDIDEEEKHQLKFKAQFSKVKFGPNSDRFLQKREGSLRRQIAKLENDISLWRNNLDFFADSKQADKLKEEFNKKIDKAKKDLKDLKDQLRLISNI